jgi:hypothetical protein
LLARRRPHFRRRLAGRSRGRRPPGKPRQRRSLRSNRNELANRAHSPSPQMMRCFCRMRSRPGCAACRPTAPNEGLLVGRRVTRTGHDPAAHAGLAGAPPPTGRWSPPSWRSNITVCVRFAPFAASWNIAGLPAIVVPLGPDPTTAGRRPVGRSIRRRTAAPGGRRAARVGPTRGNATHLAGPAPAGPTGPEPPQAERADHHVREVHGGTGASLSAMTTPASPSAAPSRASAALSP